MLYNIVISFLKTHHVCRLEKVAAAWLAFIKTCKLQKKAVLDFFQEFFKKITEGRADYELVAQEVLG